MFYKMITKKRDSWFVSPFCTVLDVIDYIVRTGQMRDAQIDAIKTYLFLKIACENKPLYVLFTQGAFNNLNLDDLEISNTLRGYLNQHPAAAALYEYATIKNEDGEQVSEKVEQKIKSAPEEIDYKKVFENVFDNIAYTDYLFSLPMGAGKTYLMATFIYLDLYFAQNEPDNTAFAHNFIIFAPSGLKSSVVPSLRTVQKFIPSWILPEPAASDLKRQIKFEILDQNKTQNKSNKTRNPNAQKINMHLSDPDLFGLIAVTNAEKVILDRIKEKDGQICLFEESDDEKDRLANELRNLIGKIPSLSVFIDEVHHAATDDKKLRAVVNNWMRFNHLNSIIGFSGTPYLERENKIQIVDKLSIASKEISNIVYYYPLADGIGNFLKRPIVKISTNENYLEIIETGVRTFFEKYKDTVYPDGTVAKLGIYCGKDIKHLEEEVYPLVERLVSELGMNPSEVVLRFHGGNKNHPISVDSKLEFESLDKHISKIRVVLLVQIGKEGWDCRSLTGIILSQEGDCPTNMVLQTSCRCLRQVQKNVPETALIYLNDGNAEKLDTQLKKQCHISIKEFENGSRTGTVTLKRYSRMDRLKLPKINFYQLKINYETLIVDESLNTNEDIENAVNDSTQHISLNKEYDMKTRTETVKDVDHYEYGSIVANFNIWI